MKSSELRVRVFLREDDIASCSHFSICIIDHDSFNPNFCLSSEIRELYASVCMMMCGDP